MTVPIFQGDRIVAVIGLANKESDYLESDVLQVSLLMEAVWKTTERMLAEESVKKLLAEKELILREVHHRIKNNMATVCGLLDFQASEAKEAPAAAALKDASRRVLSMMALYETLYNSSDFGSVSLRDYLPRLARQILGNLDGGRNVSLEVAIDELKLDAKRMAALGILVNELITNIMKYAFVGSAPGSRAGTAKGDVSGDVGADEPGCVIKISARCPEGKVIVTVADNGRGMPESVDFGNSSGFGLTLVSLLATQLQGSIRIERESGTSVVLEFPA
jgi:two-component sensor histidine kinase